MCKTIKKILHVFEKYYIQSCINTKKTATYRFSLRKSLFCFNCSVLDSKSPCINFVVNNTITLKSSNLEFFKTFEISPDNAALHQSRDRCFRVKVVT